MSASSSDPRIAQKTGEGYDKPNADQELPIDINYQKLPEWLVRASNSCKQFIALSLLL
jgi:hypothetical protein